MDRAEVSMTSLEDLARSVFLAAEDCAPTQWPAFLDEACKGNIELRARVEQLLRAHQMMGTIHGGIADPIAVMTEQMKTERLGAMVGPYKLLEQIGEGGFGMVF